MLLTYSHQKVIYILSDTKKYNFQYNYKCSLVSPFNVARVSINKTKMKDIGDDADTIHFTSI
jgi:hypothetical protein